MTKGKGRGGGPRRPRNAAGFSSDVEMQDAGFMPNERPKSKAKNSEFKARNDPERRGRVGKNPTSPPSGRQKGGGGTDGLPERRRLKSNLAVPTSTRGRKNNNGNNYYNNHQRLSIISTASMAAQGDGPWCDKCTSLNRKLHGYLLEVLRHGEDAVGEWAYAVGASPDQMECEPAPERVIPEGFRRCSSVRHQQLCAAPAPAPAVPTTSSGWSSGAAVVPGQQQGQQQQHGNAMGHTPAAAVVPYARLASALDLAQWAGTAPQPRPTLFAIPEHTSPYPQKIEPPPSKTQQLPAPQPVQPPWDAACPRPGPMYPNAGPAAHGTDYQWRYQQRNMSDGSSDQDNRQRTGVMYKPECSLALVEAMRGLGEGRVLQEERELADLGVPA